MKTIVIIGGGLGGLTAGALLAKAGHSVTLLEQHSIVGGCATNFSRMGEYTCEVGLHKMDGVYTTPAVQQIFHALGVYDALTFVPSENFYTITTQKGTYTLPYGIERARDYLIEQFPDEHRGITHYFHLIEQIGHEFQILSQAQWYHRALFPFYFPQILRHMRSSVTDLFDRLFDNEELKLILNANVQYYNDIPDTLSFLLHAVAQASYYTGKGWFIRGGSGRLSSYLSDFITEHGGTVIRSAHVTACTPDRVTYRHKKTTHSLPADLIVSNASPQDTYRFFGHPYQETRKIANGLLTVYLGFKKNLKKVYGTQDYAQYFYDDFLSPADYKTDIYRSITERKGLSFTDYSQIDSGLTKNPDKSFGAVCTTDYIEEWEKLDPAAYAEKKAQVISRVLDGLERHYPGISKLVEYAEAGTAKTQQRYLQTPQGTAYGYKPTPKQFFRPPRSRSKKIPNLYFVGQWVIAGGFSPAIMSGGICAQEIQKDIK